MNADTAAQLLGAIAQTPERGVVLAVGGSVPALVNEVLRPVSNYAPVAHTGQGTAEVLGRKVHLVDGGDPRAETRVRGMAVDLVILTDVDRLPAAMANLCITRVLRAGGTVVIHQRDGELAWGQR